MIHCQLVAITYLPEADQFEPEADKLEPEADSIYCHSWERHLWELNKLIGEDWSKKNKFKKKLKYKM